MRTDFFIVAFCMMLREKKKAALTHTEEAIPLAANSGVWHVYCEVQSNKHLRLPAITFP